VVAILVGALGERAGSLFSALAAMAMWFCGLSAVTWSSRVIWAFARDEGLPLSGVWKQVSHKHSTPVYTIWLCAAAAFLGAVYSGAYAVVTSISTIGLYLSYVIPVFLHLRAGSPLERGPWHLGKYSRAINVVAVLWVIFLSVILSLADKVRTGVTIVAVTVLLALWYGLHERRRFKGPAWTARDVAQPV
jgi:amino acid transporter